jgi:L-ascorbate metabolism protein UlaG (beta-lactamase superfamily)
MNRRTFAKIAISGILPLMSFTKKMWSVQLIRHATLVISTGKTTILVDPMLSKKGAMDPVGNAVWQHHRRTHGHGQSL